MWAKRNHNGFTIVELLIVIVVIAILAALTIVAFNGMQNRARATEAKVGIAQTKRKLEIYKVENGSYPTTGNLAAAGITDGSVTYQYTSDGTTFCATGTAGNTSYTVGNASEPTPGGCAGHGQNGVQALTNLVVNPSFESSTAPYGICNGNGFSTTLSTAQAQSGTRSIALVGAPSADDCYMETYIDNVPPGTYTYTAYIYLTGWGQVFQNRDLVWFHCSQGSCNDPAMPFNNTVFNQWQRVQKTVTANTTASFRLRFHAPANVTTYYDAIMVTRTDGAVDYKDGSSSNWVWNGTANNSTSTGPGQ